MVDCPNCGTEVAFTVKCWTVSPAKQGAAEAMPEFRVGIFECPTCKSKFRSRIRSTAKPAETTNVKNLVKKVKEIHERRKPCGFCGKR